MPSGAAKREHPEGMPEGSRGSRPQRGRIPPVGGDGVRYLQCLRGNNRSQTAGRTPGFDPIRSRRPMKTKDIRRHRPAPGVFDRVAVSTPGYLLASLRDAPASRLQKASNAIASHRGCRPWGRHPRSRSVLDPAFSATAHFSSTSQYAASINEAHAEYFRWVSLTFSSGLRFGFSGLRISVMCA